MWASPRGSVDHEEAPLEEHFELVVRALQAILLAMRVVDRLRAKRTTKPSDEIQR